MDSILFQILFHRDPFKEFSLEIERNFKLEKFRESYARQRIAIAEYNNRGALWRGENGFFGVLRGRRDEITRELVLKKKKKKKKKEEILVTSTIIHTKALYKYRC